MILLFCGEDGVERFQLREKERESSVCFYICLLFFSKSSPKMPGVSFPSFQTSDSEECYFSSQADQRLKT